METRTFASEAMSLVMRAARELDAVELHVAAPAQLELGDELEAGERGDELLEVGDRLLDEVLGV